MPLVGTESVWPSTRIQSDSGSIARAIRSATAVKLGSTEAPPVGNSKRLPTRTLITSALASTATRPAAMSSRNPALIRCNCVVSTGAGLSLGTKPLPIAISERGCRFSI